MFCGAVCVGSQFHVLCARALFRRSRGRRVPFSFFALRDKFLAVPRASGPVFMFCAPGHVFGGTEGVGSRFHVLRALPRFRRKRGCRVPFSCFALPKLFPAVPRASDLFASFALSDSFFAVPRASGPVFMFCATGLAFIGQEGVGFHFQRYRGRWLPFSCFARSDSFWRYRGRPVPFSCFALPDSFSEVPSASGLVFIFFAPGLIFGGTKGVGSRFQCFVLPDSFSAVPRASGLVLMFSLPDMFSAVPSASGPVFMFCAPGLVFSDTEGIMSLFHVLLSRTRFRRYRGRRVPFSCFACPDSFSTETRVSAPVFIFCSPGVFSRGTEGVGFRFQVLRS
jgi:hypothetical protein